MAIAEHRRRGTGGLFASWSSTPLAFIKHEEWKEIQKLPGAPSLPRYVNPQKTPVYFFQRNNLHDMLKQV